MVRSPSNSPVAEIETNPSRPHDSPSSQAPHVDAVNGHAKLPEVNDVVRLISLRFEFPEAWWNFLNPPADSLGHTMAFVLSPDRFPVQYRLRRCSVISWSLMLDLENTVQFTSGGSVKPRWEAGDRPVFEIGLPGRTPEPGTPGMSIQVTSLAELGGAPFGSTAGMPVVGVESGAPAWCLWLDETEIAKLNESLWTTVEVEGQQRARLRPEMLDDILLFVHFKVDAQA